MLRFPHVVKYTPGVSNSIGGACQRFSYDLVPCYTMFK